MLEDTRWVERTVIATYKLPFKINTPDSIALSSDNPQLCEELSILREVEENSGIKFVSIDVKSRDVIDPDEVAAAENLLVLAGEAKAIKDSELDHLLDDMLDAILG